MKRIEVIGLETVPEIQAGDDLAQILASCAEAEGVGLQDKDILVLTSKIVSKALNLMVRIDEVTPSAKALALSRKTGKDARLIQLMWDRGHEIVAMIPMEGFIRRTIMEECAEAGAATGLVEHEGAMCITRDRRGRINTQDAGIDGSNHPEGVYSFPPEDPDAVARQLRAQIRERTGRNVAVVLADTELFDVGTMDLAMGCAGIHPRPNFFGQVDKFGRPKFGGMDVVAHELTACAALLFGQLDAGIPAVIVRGYAFEFEERTGVADVLAARMEREDWRRLVRGVLRTTAHVQRWPYRWLLKVASWMV